MNKVVYVKCQNEDKSEKICVPSDKSISHRVALFSSFIPQVTRVQNFLKSADCLSTLRCLRELGVRSRFVVEKGREFLLIEGQSRSNWTVPSHALYVGNSGTSIRLMTGLLSGVDKKICLVGDGSIMKRPMKRIIDPLRQMGVDIYGFHDRAPLFIESSKIRGLNFQSQISSAQVKSCLLLAGLWMPCSEQLVYQEPYVSRDHTENMFQAMGADIQVDKENCQVTLQGGSDLKGLGSVFVPSDPSSSAFFVVLALILGKCLSIQDVCLNPTRIGYLSILQQMGADIQVQVKSYQAGEPIGEIQVFPSRLKGIRIEGSIIPNVIDEIPILSIASLFAEGETVVAGAEELRVKESDRICSIVQGIQQLGGVIKETVDGFILQGQSGNWVEGGQLIQTHYDHRIAMAFSIASVLSQKGVLLDDTSCISTSFPNFFDVLSQVVDVSLEERV